VDRRGTLYVADAGNRTIRKITASGQVSTLAGSHFGNGSADGRGPAAQFDMMYGVVLDRDDNLYVADSGNNAIRKVSPEGVVTTVAGLAHEGGIRLGDLPGRLSQPWGVALTGRRDTLMVTSSSAVLKLVLP
jgi:DNA-binding beta-propeller fold protein YncE